MFILGFMKSPGLLPPGLLPLRTFDDGGFPELPPANISFLLPVKFGVVSFYGGLFISSREPFYG